MGCERINQAEKDEIIRPRSRSNAVREWMEIELGYMRFVLYQPCSCGRGEQHVLGWLHLLSAIAGDDEQKVFFT